MSHFRTVRVVGVAHQSELAPSGSSAQDYWIVSALLADDDLDFQLLRGSLQARQLVGMGVVAGAQTGCGAVLLVPLDEGFALHALNRRNATGPFEEALFSQRVMTVLVADWADQISPNGVPSAKTAVLASGRARAPNFGTSQARDR